jgi:hypothetical protein
MVAMFDMAAARKKSITKGEDIMNKPLKLWENAISIVNFKIDVRRLPIYKLFNTIPCPNLIFRSFVNNVWKIIKNEFEGRSGEI